MTALPHRTPTTHLEAVMGTVVGITSPHPLPPAGLAAAMDGLHDADRVFSTWDPDSPMSRLRSGRATLDDLAPADALVVAEVLERCAVARELTSGAFDPWAMPGGLDPTGLVKGWAGSRALAALGADGCRDVMVNAGGDVAVTGTAGCRPWRVGIRHPAQPDAYLAVVEVTGAVATSGDYERPGQLIDPRTGRVARAAASATVTGPDLALADALATGLAVAGRTLLPAIEAIPGYDALLVDGDGHCAATPGMAPTRRSPAEDPPSALPEGDHVQVPGGEHVGERHGRLTGERLLVGMALREVGQDQPPRSRVAGQLGGLAGGHVPVAVGEVLLAGEERRLAHEQVRVSSQLHRGRARPGVHDKSEDARRARPADVLQPDGALGRGERSLLDQGPDGRSLDASPA